METGLLTIATFPVPAPVGLLTEGLLGRNPTPPWRRWRCRQIQSSRLIWFGQHHTPVAMKVGWLTMATLPVPVRAGVAFQRPALPQLRGTASVSARRLAGAASHATASARSRLAGTASPPLTTGAARSTAPPLPAGLTLASRATVPPATAIGSQPMPSWSASSPRGSGASTVKLRWSVMEQGTASGRPGAMQVRASG